MHQASLDKALHDRIVLAQVRAYQDEGIEILAVNIEGWTRPTRIGAHVPDIVAKHQGRTIYNEVETCETVVSPETRERCEDLARAGALHITIPRICLKGAELTMQRWKIPVELWWCYDGA